MGDPSLATLLRLVAHTNRLMVADIGGLYLEERHTPTDGTWNEPVCQPPEFTCCSPKRKISEPIKGTRMNLRCDKGTHALSTITNPDSEKLSDLSKEKDGHLATAGARKETLKGRIMKTAHGDVSAGQAVPLEQTLPGTTGVKIWAPVNC